MARRQLRSERPGHTLQPTALVNEAYLRLVSDQASDWLDRVSMITIESGNLAELRFDNLAYSLQLWGKAYREE